MVRNPEGESRISPKDVAFCWRGEEVADLWAPVAGETFVTYDLDDRIVDRYPGRDDCGNFVVSSGDDFFRIVPENGYWSCSGENPADPGEIATVFGENRCDGPSPVL